MSLDAPTRPSSPAADPAPEPRRRALVDRLRPGPGEVVDVVLGAVLAAFGVVGFRSVFAGGEELVVGLPGVVLGAAVAFVLVKLKPPIIVGAAIATVTFVVLAGPVALRHRAGAGFLPSADATTGLADGVVNGWIQLLTTLPPAGRSGDLLAIPYLCGYLGAALAVTLALVYPRRSWCVFPPAAVLALSVLMGTKEPASLLLQGFAFAALTIAWVSVRDHRARTGDAAAALPRSRLAAGAALLAVSAIGGVVIGPHLPGANPDERYVLREDVTPPFDPLTEPSPLAGYRNYTDQDVRDDKILTAEGLPKNARLRIATMDRYSGTEWEATGDGSVLAGEYLRVGAEIPSEGFGDEASVSVEIHKPDGVWVPLGGDVTGLAFEGSRAEKLDDEVRVSVETDTAAIPDQLQAGDRYRFTSEFVTVPDRTVLMGTPIDGRYTAEPGEVAPEFVSRGADWARDQPTKYAEMLAVATGLQTEGAYTDGGEEANPVSPLRPRLPPPAGVHRAGAAVRQRRAVRRRPGPARPVARRAGARRDGVRQREGRRFGDVPGERHRGVDRGPGRGLRLDRHRRHPTRGPVARSAQAAPVQDRQPRAAAATAHDHPAADLHPRRARTRAAGGRGGAGGRGRRAARLGRRRRHRRRRADPGPRHGRPADLAGEVAASTPSSPARNARGPSGRIVRRAHRLRT